MDRNPFTPHAIPNVQLAGLYASFLSSDALVAAQPNRNRAIVFEYGIADLCECGAPLLTQGFQQFGVRDLLPCHRRPIHGAVANHTRGAPSMKRSARLLFQVT